MSSKPSKKAAAPKRTGPKPERLVIDDNWKAAIKKTLDRGQPPKTKPAMKKRRSK